MAQDFYKRQVGDKAIAINSNPQKAPSIQNGLNYIEKRRQLLNQAVDAMAATASGLVNLKEKHDKYYDAQEGKTIGSGVDLKDAKDVDIEKSGSRLFGGDAKREAFDEEISDRLAKQMAEDFEKNYKSRLEAGEERLPLDQLDSETRRGKYLKFKDSWMEGQDAKSQTYFKSLALKSNDIMNKHLTILDRKGDEYQQQRAVGAMLDNVSSEISGLAKKASQGGLVNSKGEPIDFNESVSNYFNSNRNKHIAIAGSSENADKLIFDKLVSQAAGLTSGGIPDKGIRSYLNSEEGMKRFSHISGHDRALYQVDHATTAYDTAEKRALNAKEVGDTYALMNNSGFGSEKDVDDYFRGTKYISEQQKYELKTKIMRGLKVQAEADDLHAAYRANQDNIVRSGKPEAVEKLFSMNVGDKSSLNMQDANSPRFGALSDWLSRDLPVPSFVKDFGSMTVDNTSAGQQVLNEQLSSYAAIRRSAGPSALSKVFSPEAMGKIELWSFLTNDTEATTEAKKKALDDYDMAVSKNYFMGSDKETNFKKDLFDDGVSIFRKEAKDSDIQPWFTFQNASASSTEYAEGYMNKAYKAFRLGGKNHEDAKAMAEQSFENNHDWVEWAGGQEGYLSKDLGGDVNAIYRFLNYKNVIKELSNRHGISSDEVKKRLTVVPSESYNITKQYDVLFDEVPTLMNLSESDSSGRVRKGKTTFSAADIIETREKANDRAIQDENEALEQARSENKKKRDRNAEMLIKYKNLAPYFRP